MKGYETHWFPEMFLACGKCHCFLGGALGGKLTSHNQRPSRNGCDCFSFAYMHAHAEMRFLYCIYSRSRRYKKANAVVDFGHL